MKIAQPGSVIPPLRPEARLAYKAPVLLKEIEYVEAWCGTSYSFLVHNWPNQTKVSKLKIGGRKGA